MRTLAALSLLLVVGCSDPEPTCSAAETPYDFCSDEQIWTCPQGSPDALAEKAELQATCDDAPDSFACIVDLEFEMFPTDLKSDCAAGGQVCVPADEESGLGASCEDPE